MLLKLLIRLKGTGGTSGKNRKKKKKEGEEGEKPFIALNGCYSSLFKSKEEEKECLGRR